MELKAASANPFLKHLIIWNQAICVVGCGLKAKGRVGQTLKAMVKSLAFILSKMKKITCKVLREGMKSSDWKDWTISTEMDFGESEMTS